MKFELSEYERKTRNAWEEEHVNTYHDGEWPYAGAAGGGVSYILTPTGLGMFIGMECSFCRLEGKDRSVWYKCITDLETIG